MRSYLLLCVLTLTATADPLWVRTYNGPDSSYDEVRAIVADDWGNIIVTGSSAMSGNDYEFATIKYRPNGDTIWLRRYNPGPGRDGATALTVDREGNVIVAGYLGGPYAEYGDWVVCKYSAAGDLLWNATYDHGNMDKPSAVAVDSIGNCYVTGNAGNVNEMDFVVVKYSSRGEQLWEFRRDRGGHEVLTDIAVEPTGNSYVTGFSRSGNRQQLVTWKLSRDGDSLWVSDYHGPPFKDNSGVRVVLDNQGNVVVAGNSYYDTLNPENYLVVKHTAEGETLWAREYNGPANMADILTGLAVDRAGNVYVTGRSYISQLYCNCATLKWSSDGRFLWVRDYSGPWNLDRSCAIVVDENANVHVAGSSVGHSLNWDVFVVKYDSAGILKWEERWNGPATSADWGNALAMSRAGTVYVGGAAVFAETGSDYLALAYSATGGMAEELAVPGCTGRGAARLTSARRVLSCSERDAYSVLLDAMGRRVLELHAGENDVSRLAPGVYFVCPGPGNRRGAVKVVVTE